jgi:hypothetical protein
MATTPEDELEPEPPPLLPLEDELLLDDALELDDVLLDDADELDELLLLEELEDEELLLDDKLETNHVVVVTTLAGDCPPAPFKAKSSRRPVRAPHPSVARTPPTAIVEGTHHARIRRALSWTARTARGQVARLWDKSTRG